MSASAPPPPARRFWPMVREAAIAWAVAAGCAMASAWLLPLIRMQAFLHQIPGVFRSSLTHLPAAGLLFTQLARQHPLWLLLWATIFLLGAAAGMLGGIAELAAGIPWRWTDLPGTAWRSLVHTAVLLPLLVLAGLPPLLLLVGLVVAPPALGPAAGAALPVAVVLGGWLVWRTAPLPVAVLREGPPGARAASRFARQHMPSLLPITLLAAAPGAACLWLIAAAWRDAPLLGVLTTTLLGSTIFWPALLVGRRYLGLAATPRCTRCGGPATAGDRFCRRCGSPLSPVREVPS